MMRYCSQVGTASQEIRYQYAEEKDGAGNADKAEEKINRLFQRRHVRCSDGTHIDEKTEAQAEEETDRFKHGV